MQYFVKEGSVVREIWGKSVTILFIFAGAAAEFALNRSVDWLYYTGKLPADPLGRLFSTVGYARRIVFSPLHQANKAIDGMQQIHEAVERSRGEAIPARAYRDVLFMLIHYSITAFELLERKLNGEEKAEVYDVFYRLGARMGLEELNPDYQGWLRARERHLQENLVFSPYTKDLFDQYKKQLGPLRFRVLTEAQILVVPPRVKKLLHYRNLSLLTPMLPLYQLARRVKLDGALKKLLIPAGYNDRVKELDRPSSRL